MSIPEVMDADSVEAAWAADDRDQVLLTWTEFADGRRSIRTVLLSCEASGAVAASIHRLFVAACVESGRTELLFPRGRVLIDGGRVMIEMEEH